MTPRVDWAALKAWVAEKEAYEAQNGHPAPLSEEQASAIAILLRPPSRPEPTLGSQNWSGILNHFLQVSNQRVTFTDEPRQDPRLGRAPELRWACFVTFDTTGDRFPRPGYGVDEGAPKSPDFTRKQDAKKFAAKCACDWLTDIGQMLPSGELPKFPPAYGPAPPRAAPAPAPAVLHVPAKRAPPSSPPAVMPRDVPMKQVPQPTAPPTSLFSRPATSLSPKQKPSKAPRTVSPPKDSPSRSPSSSSNPVSASTSANSSSATTPNAGVAVRHPSPSDLPATKRVEQLANRLNLPIPRYVLKEDASLPGADFWSGTADFDDNPRIPPGLGKVTKAFTKKGAREKMADEILAWMHAEQDKRDQKKRVVLGV